LIASAPSPLAIDEARAQIKHPVLSPVLVQCTANAGFLDLWMPVWGTLKPGFDDRVWRLLPVCDVIGHQTGKVIAECF
jgi:hypothetical protein